MIVCVADPRPVFQTMSFVLEDCAAAVENILLALTSLGYATVWFEGAAEFTVAFAVAAIGDPVYILADGSALTGTASGNNLYGHALSTKAATSGPLTVRIAN